MGLLRWLESTAYADWILTSARGWPFMLSMHAIGLAIIVGIVFSCNLRLLGLYSSIPYTSLRRLLSIAWIGFCINLVTGLSIFTTQATSYIVSPPFILKITFIALGSWNLYYTQKILQRDAASWEAAGAVPQIGTTLGISSLVFWTMSVITGRLIAYLA